LRSPPYEFHFSCFDRTGCQSLPVIVLRGCNFYAVADDLAAQYPGVIPYACTQVDRKRNRSCDLTRLCEAFTRQQGEEAHADR
jgi:hypothetical protein